MAVDVFELPRGAASLRGDKTPRGIQYSMRAAMLYTMLCVALVWRARVQTSSAVCVPRIRVRWPISARFSHPRPAGLVLAVCAPETDVCVMRFHAGAPHRAATCALGA